METFILPKADGTKYRITGTALTPVYYEGMHRAPMTNSVIELASGEKILFVASRPEYPTANRHVSVKKIYRNAQDMNAQEIADATGTDQNHRIWKALEICEVEEIA